MVYIAFDFGTTSWGVAMGDEVSQTFSLLEAVKAEGGDPKWAIIDGYIHQWRPDAIVIGYPLKANGERFKLTDLVDEAIKALESRYPTLPVHKADERLSTVQAKESLFAEHGQKGLAKGRVDSESARIILSDWFEQNIFNSKSD